MKSDSQAQYLDTSARTFETVVKRNVERPVQEEIKHKYPGFKMIEVINDDKPRLAKSVIRLRKLASLIKIERDSFKRQ